MNTVVLGGLEYRFRDLKVILEHITENTGVVGANNYPLLSDCVNADIEFATVVNGLFGRNILVCQSEEQDYLLDIPATLKRLFANPTPTITNLKCIPMEFGSHKFASKTALKNAFRDLRNHYHESQPLNAKDSQFVIDFLNVYEPDAVANYDNIVIEDGMFGEPAIVGYLNGEPTYLPVFNTINRYKAK